VAGLCARTDFEAGPHLAPANRHLNWVHALTTGIGDELQGVLNPQGINCVRSLPGRGIRVYGARTVSSDPDWRFVNVRRLMMMIERAVLESVQWSVFEPNNVFTRQLLVVSISSFLDGLWRRGALVGDTGAQAYYVKCDEGNNPSVIADLGELLVEVGVAAVRPAEFVVFRIGRTQDGLEAVE